MSVLDKKYQIYLAGKMSGLSYDDMNQWRLDMKRKLLELASLSNYRVSVINPVDFYNFESVQYQSDAEVMDYDLSHVAHSNFIIVNCENLSTSIDTNLEIYDAWTRKIPLFAFGDYKHPHPWIERCIRRFEPDMDAIITYLRDFYFI